MRVVVLYGGDGEEREVSLKSGREVCRGLEDAGHSVIPWEVGSLEEIIQHISECSADIFFIALHGDWGEDGRLQAVLSGAKKSFTGSSFSACTYSMDKWRSKILFSASSIPVAPAFLAERGGSVPSVPEWIDSDNPMVVVKPNSGGSTIGVSIVDITDPKAFCEALEEAFRHDSSAVVEKYIPGRELTVTVTSDGDHIGTLPVVEIVPLEGFYSYEAKYTSGKSSYIAPADLEPEILQRVNDVSLKAFDALGCRIYARVDIRLDREGVPFVLEVNTVPGMTSTSLVPKAAAASGITFSDFLNSIVERSLSFPFR